MLGTGKSREVFLQTKPKVSETVDDVRVTVNADSILLFHKYMTL